MCGVAQMTPLEMKQKIIENLKEVISELENQDEQSLDMSFLNDLDERVTNLKWWEY